MPASGFYEFQATKTVKNRLRFSVAGDNYFSFAGFWNRFSDDLSTFTFITTEPSEWFSQFHNRQAVILRPDDYDRWLDSRATVESLKGLLVPWREELKAEPAPKGG